MSRLIYPLLAAFLTLWLPACGGDGRLKVSPVKGQLFVDGQPAEDAMVYFHPQDGLQIAGMRPYAQVEKDGSFAAATYEKGDGLPPGKYALTFTWKQRSGITKTDFEGPDRLKGKHEKLTDQSPRVTVNATATDLGRIDLPK